MEIKIIIATYRKNNRIVRSRFNFLVVYLWLLLAVTSAGARDPALTSQGSPQEGNRCHRGFFLHVSSCTESLSSCLTSVSVSESLRRRLRRESSTTLNLTEGELDHNTSWFRPWLNFPTWHRMTSQRSSNEWVDWSDSYVDNQSIVLITFWAEMLKYLLFSASQLWWFVWFVLKQWIIS